jgi:hypothetical protein
MNCPYERRGSNRRHHGGAGGDVKTDLRAGGWCRGYNAALL